MAEEAAGCYNYGGFIIFTVAALTIPIESFLILFKVFDLNIFFTFWSMFFTLLPMSTI